MAGSHQQFSGFSGLDEVFILEERVFRIDWEVWNLYISNRLHEAVDRWLEGRFQEEDASRVLTIGLLSAQASDELRPSMSMVVKMLMVNAIIPIPTQPPFLSSSTGVPPIRLKNRRSGPESNSLPAMEWIISR